MELRHLRYFVAVAEELNYRKASERLHVTAPSLSMQIIDLEDELGVRLLDRDTRGVRLTNAGAVFLAKARLILGHSQDAMVAAREAEKGRKGQLAVGFNEPTMMGFMPASLMAFHSQYPDVAVSLVEMSVADQLAALEAGKIQIGFNIDMSANVSRRFQYAKIAHSAIRAVMVKSHRLAGSPRVALPDLLQETLLSLLINEHSTPLHRELIRRTFVAYGLKPGRINQILGAEPFRAMLEGGLGVSLIPDIGGLSRSEALILKPLEENGPKMSIDLYVLWRNVGISTITSSFVGVLQAIAHSGKPRAKHR